MIYIGKSNNMFEYKFRMLSSFCVFRQTGNGFIFMWRCRKPLPSILVSPYLTFKEVTPWYSSQYNIYYLIICHHMIYIGKSNNMSDYKFRMLSSLCVFRQTGNGFISMWRCRKPLPSILVSPYLTFKEVTPWYSSQYNIYYLIILLNYLII